MQRKPLPKFVLLTFALLPVMFALWFFMASLLASLLGGITHALLDVLEPGVFADFKVIGSALEIGTRIPMASLGEGYRNAPGFLAFDVNPMLYGYGTPLFLALFFAAPLAWGKQPWQLVVGMVVLLAIQCWGISFDIYKTLTFNFSDVAAAYIGLSSFGRTFVAYGYQLGSLMLPVIAPVALWFGLFNQHWRKLFIVAQQAEVKPRNSFSR